MASSDSQRPASTPLGEYANEQDDEAFWREVAPRHEPLRRPWYLPTVLVLVTLSIPWYLPARWVDRLVGGLPVWTWIALVCSGGLAVVTAWVALRHWRDGAEEES